jgi:hypothetical protein
VLRRYHERLQVHAVRDHTWDDLLVDYRLALLEWLFAPVHDHAEGSRRSYWWPKMNCLVAAAQDLKAAALLE